EETWWREGAAAARRRDDREKKRGVGLGQPVVDEPVRRVVATALRDRPLLDEPRNGHESRVEDRDREHEEWEQDRRRGGSRDRPARGQRERGESEADHHAPRVAHE